MKASTKLREILNNPRATERDAQEFLKSYPMLMVRLFNVSWNYYLAVPEFALGTDFRADFLVVSADSGRWHVVFVELEGPNDRIYLKNGQPSKKLRTAQKQLDDWQRFVCGRTDEVKQELAKVLKPRRIHAQNRLMGRGGYAHDEILLPDVFLHEQYKIVIGRRSSFADEPTHHMPAPGFGYAGQVSTYDRVYDCLVDEEAKSRAGELERYLRCDDRRSVHL